MHLKVLYNDGQEEEIQLEGKKAIQLKLQELAVSEQIATIEVIELGVSANAFSEMLEHNKGILHLSVLEAGDELFEQVCKAIAKTPWLKTFRLERGSISSDSLRVFEKNIKELPNLEYLYLENYRAVSREIDLTPLNNALEKCGALQSLSVELGQVTQEAAGALYQASVVDGNVNAFRVVSSDSDHHPMAGITFRIAFDDGLAQLDLFASHLGALNVRNLCAALLNHKTIEHLGLRFNDIGGNIGSDAVAQLIEKNPSLRSIDLCGNKIGDGAGAIGKALANTKLYKIDLSSNEIEDDGLKSIACSITSGAKIASIILDGNMDITQSGVDALYLAMRDITSIYQTEVTLYNKTGAWYLHLGKYGYKDFSADPAYYDIELDKVSGIRGICEANMLKIKSELGFTRIELPDSEGVDFSSLFCLLSSELRSYVAAGMDVGCLVEMLSTEEAWSSESFRHDFAGSHGAMFDLA